MDPTPVNLSSSPIDGGEEWDADGFVIPSLAGETDLGTPNVPALSNLPNSSSQKTLKEEKIYLGPHGAPPHVKQQEVSITGRKQFKSKLKETEKKTGLRRPNQVGYL